MAVWNILKELEFLLLIGNSQSKCVEYKNKLKKKYKEFKRGKIGKSILHNTETPFLWCRIPKGSFQ